VNPSYLNDDINHRHRDGRRDESRLRRRDALRSRLSKISSITAYNFFLNGSSLTRRGLSIRITDNDNGDLPEDGLSEYLVQ